MDTKCRYLIIYRYRFLRPGSGNHPTKKKKKKKKAKKSPRRKRAKYVTAAFLAEKLVYSSNES